MINKYQKGPFCGPFFYSIVSSILNISGTLPAIITTELFMKTRVIFLTAIIGFFILTVLLPRSLSFKEELLFTINQGEGSKDIAFDLEKEKMIWWRQLFRAYVLIRSTADQLQAGTYRISPSMSILTLAEKFASGDVAKETITIPEGFTSKQIWARLQVLPGYDKQADLASLKEFEGMLFPDTYQIPYGLPLDKVIKIMIDNFWRKNEGLATTHQVVVMASILEKELQTKEDKAIASGILWKRIRVGMPLQVDADLWTYHNTGLPEKPISNPGLDSIKAALEPQDSLYWYYLSTPEGKTIFSKTLEEHNAARAKYLK